MKDFLSELIKKDIHINLIEGQLSVKFPKSGVHKPILEEIKSRKEAIIEYLATLKENTYTVIPTVAYAEHYPISDAQRRLWVLSQFEGVSVSYNIPSSIHLNQNINIEYFRRTLDSVIQRHEILRTVFKEDETGEVRQWVLKKEDLGFEIDYRDFRKEKDKEEKVKNYIAEDSVNAFDLANGPLLRASLIRVEENEYVFYYNMHHIICDGWSMEVMRKDVFSYYDAYESNTESELKPLRIHYKDYSTWQLSQIQEESFKAHREHWLSSLKGELPLLNLPSKRQRPRLKTNNGLCLSTYIDRATSGKLKKYSLENGGSLFMGLLAVWNILMYHYTEQKDIIIGSPIAGRENADLEDQIGCYINTLALRNEIKPDESFDSLFRRLKDNTLKSYNHQIYPFDRLVEELNLQRDTSRSGVFDVMLILQNNGENNQELDLKEDELNRITDLGHCTSKFDIDITFQEIGDYLSLQLVYNPDVYEKEMIEGLINHYKQLLHAVLENPEEKISLINYLSETEIHELLFNFNDTEVDYAKDKTIVDLFEEQVAKTPHNIAIVFEETELTYRELNEQANQLAYYLQKNYAIQPDDLVCIMQGRSEWIIISILGVLKAGGAYVPIDPTYPVDRIKYIENDTKCKVRLDENELNKFKKSLESYSKQKVDSVIKAYNLAYVIYTSGSTGSPKGVMIEHKNVINFFRGMTSVLGKRPGSFLSMTNFTFDISVLELLWTLSTGYKVVIQGDVREIVEQDNNKFLDFSLFYFGNTEEGNDNYKLLIEGAKYADDNGYSAVWTPERHFHEFGGLYPNPSLTAASLSLITKNISIRAGSVVFPLHHPIRIAEDWSVIDNLSNGRAGVACASGWHADDFVLSPLNFEKRHDVMYKSIDTLQKLWNGEKVTFENGNGNLKEIKIFPKPIQAKLPLWITSGGQIDTFISAGKLGVNILTHLLGETVEGLAEKIIAYRKAYTENGYNVKNAKVTLMLHTYIDEDESNVEKKTRQPFINYIKSSTGLLQRHMADLYNKDEIDRLSDQDLDVLYEHAYNRFLASASLVGTRKSCFEMLEKLSSIGVNEIACLIDFGVDYQSTMQSLERLTALKGRYNASTRDYSVYSQIEKHKITHLQITPTMGGILNQSMVKDSKWSSMKTILLGGERLTLPLVKSLYEKLPHTEIYNMYGPTETTIWSTFNYVEQGTEKIVIGKPIINTSIYIFDENQRLLPVGIQGEIYIGGEGVARGYTSEELTEQRFIENPYRPGERIYRTGDFGKWLSNGSIDYSGRKDDQVKIRGYRIELGEIEYALLKNEQIEEAVVLLKGTEEKGRELIAYIKAKSQQDTSEVRSYLKNILPEYMLPVHYVQ
ncbi:MAG: LLM class flavin-dependent oxidoreductase, partial [Leadbetterella sp.]|nr:LLM class flavin-dependent oxidoreductase [Leadbetterella sp.]